MNRTSEGDKLRVSFSRDLGFFLTGRDRGTSLARRASVKDIVESFGVPHTEVGRLRFHGTERGFGFVPEAPGTLEVEGIPSPRDLSLETLLRPGYVGIVKFVADLNVLKLGQYLAFLGYDTVLAREESDARIADLACAQNRIVLTRDTRMLFRRKIIFARRIRAKYPAEQLTEVVSFFGLHPDPALFFSRCAACNCCLEAVDKADIFHLLEPKTRKYVHTFRRCPNCGRIYWPGSHYTALRERFRDLGILN